MIERSFLNVTLIRGGYYGLRKNVVSSEENC